MNDAIERSQTHATFAIERTYPVPAEAVWHALSDNDARAKWFSGGSEFEAREKSHEFRVGGHGMEDGQWHGGPQSRFCCTDPKFESISEWKARNSGGDPR
jgi:uncharacterized protein YndB with AHSA1/START domain